MKPMPRAIIAIPLILGCVFFALFCYQTINTTYLESIQIQTTGKVTQITPKKETVSSGGKFHSSYVTTIYLPTIVFSANNGETITFESDADINPNTVHVGDAITIVYNGKNPKDAYLASAFHASSWATAIVFLIFSVVFFIGSFLLKMLKKKMLTMALQPKSQSVSKQGDVQITKKSKNNRGAAILSYSLSIIYLLLKWLFPGTNIPDITFIFVNLFFILLGSAIILWVYIAVFGIAFNLGKMSDDEKNHVRLSMKTLPERTMLDILYWLLPIGLYVYYITGLNALYFFVWLPVWYPIVYFLIEKWIKNIIAS